MRNKQFMFLQQQHIGRRKFIPPLPILAQTISLCAMSTLMQVT